MKLFKRFSTLKKCAGAAALALSLFALASCENMTTLPAPTMTATASKTLYAPAWPEQTDDNGNPIAGLTYGERYYTVSQGLKRKISLSWNSVEIAKYYEIYAAQNINDTFVKVGESEKTEFTDSVASGTSYYYKVRAVNSKGEFSEFSSVVKGSSLATPIITDITITDTSATVFWYMGNVGVDTYAKKLVYEIHSFNGNEEKVATIPAWDSANQALVEQYTFENLNGHTDYKFRVDAYITSEQNDVEKSPEVSKETLALYNPVSPEFAVSQGESIDYVKIFITLPSKVNISTETNDQNHTPKNEDYPICFEIQRKRSTDENWTTVVPTLYYTGSTEKPTDYRTKPYVEGEMIEYDDAIGTTALSVARGVKYDYRIISCIDTNYSVVEGLTFDVPLKSKESTAIIAQGWAAARPTFRVKNYKRNISGDTVKQVDSVSLGFYAEWNDLGKAGDYKFAVEYVRSYKDSSENDKTKTDWLVDTNLNAILDNLEAVSALTAFYDVKNDEANVKGTYTYTLYVFPSKYTDTNKIKSDYLDKVKAASSIAVDKKADEPYRDLKAEGGWTDHILLTWTVEDDVAYSINWCQLTEAGDEDDTVKGIITSDQLKNSQGIYTGRYEHHVPSGHRYRYKIKADASEGNTDQSDIPEAETLGTPVVFFEANSYTDISLEWKQVVAAENYSVKIGTAGSFGNGATFTIDKDGNASDVPDDLIVTPNFDPATNVISLTISKPYGYNDATLSGKAVPLVVTAMSEMDDQNNIKGKSPATKDVWTIGPGSINLKATEAFDVETTSVKITWKKLSGAKGYAVYRMRPTMTANINSSGEITPKLATIDVYFVNEAGSAASKSGADVDSDADGNITFIDNYQRKSGNDQYEVNQQYLALGLPFTYTVIPVLASGDATAVDSFDDIKPTGESYENLADIQKIGYTTGYGIALEATKAEYNDKVTLKWELPQSAIDKGKIPTLWYRKKGTDDEWTPSGKIIKNPMQDTVDFTPKNVDATTYDDTIQALEYAVTYTDAMDISDDSSKDSAYVEYLKDDKINLNKSLDTNEIKCVGYMFNLPNITYEKITESNESYDETFQWHLYNWNNERVLPKDISGYTLTVKNLNCSADEWTIYKYNTAGKVSYTENGYSWYDITPSSSDNNNTVTVTITPGNIDKSANTGTHAGLLKVLRDYEHQYTITAERPNYDPAIGKATLCRKITKDEFAKCVTLIMADSQHQKGGKGGELANTAGGSFTVDVSEYNGRIHYNYYYWYTNYRARFAKLPGQATPFDSKFTLSCSKSAKGCAYSNAVFGWGPTTITVSHSNGLKSYQGSVNLQCGILDPWSFERNTHWDLTLSYSNGFGSDSKTVSGNETNFKQWFPFALGTKLGDSENDGTNSSYPTMSINSYWWGIRQK